MSESVYRQVERNVHPPFSGLPPAVEQDFIPIIPNPLDRAAELEAENERLRGLLRQAGGALDAAVTFTMSPLSYSTVKLCTAIRDRIDAALAGPPAADAAVDQPDGSRG